MSGGKSSHVVDHRREVGRSIQLDSVEGVVIGSYDSINASTEGLAGVKSQEELVRHLKPGRDPGSETKRGEHFVRVVVLDDITHCPDRCHILVGSPAWVFVMEGARVGRIPVGAGEVDGDGEVDLEAGLQVISFTYLPTHLPAGNPRRSGCSQLGST